MLVKIMKFQYNRNMLSLINLQLLANQAKIFTYIQSYLLDIFCAAHPIKNSHNKASDILAYCDCLIFIYPTESN